MILIINLLIIQKFRYLYLNPRKKNCFQNEADGSYAPPKWKARKRENLERKQIKKEILHFLCLQLQPGSMAMSPLLDDDTTLFDVNLDGTSTSEDGGYEPIPAPKTKSKKPPPCTPSLQSTFFFLFFFQ